MANDASKIRIEAVHADLSCVTRHVLGLPAGATVALALRELARIDPAVWPPDVGQGALGIFGRRVTCDRILDEGDRLELYRPLQVDPKEARRRRVARNGKAAG